MIWSLMCNVPQAMGLRSRFDGYDLERMGLLIIADRDVFTRRKAVGSESISRFIVIGPGAIVVKDPTRVLAAPRFMYEKAELVVFALPEPPHAAIFTRVLPELRIDVAVRIQRCHKFVSMVCGACRKILRAGEMKPNAFQRVGQSHGQPHIRSKCN